MKNYIIILLLLRPFYNLDGWTVAGIEKAIIYFIICLLLSIAAADIEKSIKKGLNTFKN